MTDETRDEGAGEAIEDLEAPAEVQRAVAGGDVRCASPTCVGTRARVWCAPPTCKYSSQMCLSDSKEIVVSLQ